MSMIRTYSPRPELLLPPAALYGLPGRIVRTIDPHTEADPVATLVHILVGAGNIIGPGPHARVQHDRHPLRLNAVLVGPTSKGRKGLAWSTARECFSRADRDLVGVLSGAITGRGDWVRDCVDDGLSSGEGLIYRVRDAQGSGEEADPGVPDKRLLVIEQEFAITLKIMARDGNSLSGVIRKAWDSGNLTTLTRNNPLKATGAHISIIGHTVEDEVRRYLTETERGNGFANRFLWLLVCRSKLLPEGGAMPDAELDALAKELRTALDFARGVGAIVRDPKARDLWATVYPQLSDGRPGLLGAVLSRAEAQVLRLSAVYAVLDCSALICVPHLEAALAVWEYAERSATRIFGDRLGNPTADRIWSALKTVGKTGMTETDLRDHFGRHKGAGEIDAALDLLMSLGLAQPERQPTGGRPATMWRLLE